LRDRDELTTAQVKRLAKTGKVHVLARREIENYFLDEAIVGPVLRDRLDDAGLASSEWTDAAIVAALRRIADTTVELVALKRLAYGFRDQRLLSRADVAKIVRTGISLAAIKSEVSRVRGATTMHDVERDWKRHMAEVRASWELRWAELAPGADVLSALWHDAGLSFDKIRDCERLAVRSAPAREIRDALESFGIEMAET
jgi:hypothetical protein